MKLILDGIACHRGDWSLSATGTFEEGIHLITGAVGSGKSTLALVAGKNLSPSTGQVFYESITRVILSLQFPEHHITGQTVAEEIRSWGLPPEPVLSDARLWERSSDDPFLLSRGELKRLHLECILRLPVDLLILDEPFSGLDPAEKELYCSRIEKCRTSGITLVLTHEQDFFPKIDCIWEIQENCLRFLGSPPYAYHYWNLIPRVVQDLLDRGTPPQNLRRSDFREALCRTRD